MFLVVFRNRKRADADLAAYDADAARMEQLAALQPGYISFAAYTRDDGEVVALSEWEDEASARAWRQHAEHLAMQAKGRASYYAEYTLFACPDPRIYRYQAKDEA